MKELQWNKEKEEYVKNLKTQESLLQKMTGDRTHYETRWLIYLTLRGIYEFIIPDLLV